MIVLFTFCVRLVDMEARLGVLAQRTAEERSGQVLLHLAATSGTASGQPSQNLRRPLILGKDQAGQIHSSITKSSTP